jgi:hypothetical protein
VSELDLSTLPNAVTLDGRLHDLAALMRRELTSARPAAPRLASLLRAMNAQLRPSIDQILGRMDGAVAQVFAPQLRTAWEGILGLSRDTLRYGLTQHAAYAAGATRVVAAIEGLGPLDEQMRATIAAAVPAS